MESALEAGIAASSEPGTHASRTPRMTVRALSCSPLAENNLLRSAAGEAVREVRMTSLPMHCLAAPGICPEDQGASLPSTGWGLVVAWSREWSLPSICFSLSPLLGFIHQIPPPSKGIQVLLLGSGPLWYLAYLPGHQRRLDKLGGKGSLNILWSGSDPGEGDRPYELPPQGYAEHGNCWWNCRGVEGVKERAPKKGQ